MKKQKNEKPKNRLNLFFSKSIIDEIKNMPDEEISEASDNQDTFDSGIIRDGKKTNEHLSENVEDVINEKISKERDEGKPSSETLVDQDLFPKISDTEPKEDVENKEVDILSKIETGNIRKDIDSDNSSSFSNTPVEDVQRENQSREPLPSSEISTVKKSSTSEEVKDLKQKLKKEVDKYYALQNEYDSLSAKAYYARERVKSLEAVESKLKTENSQLQNKISKISHDLDMMNQRYDTSINELEKLKEENVKTKAEVGSALIRLYEDFPTLDSLEEARNEKKHAVEVINISKKQASEIIADAQRIADNKVKDAEKEIEELRKKEQKEIDDVKLRIKEYIQKLDSIKEMVDSATVQNNQ